MPVITYWFNMWVFTYFDDTVSVVNTTLIFNVFPISPLSVEVFSSSRITLISVNQWLIYLFPASFLFCSISYFFSFSISRPFLLGKACSLQSYLAAIDCCFSLAYLLSECHHGKGCRQTPFKLHVNNLGEQNTFNNGLT